MAVREFVLMVQESAYKTPVGSPVLGTSMVYPRLSESDAFSVRDSPILVPVMRGGGINTKAYTIAGKQECSGALKMVMCYSTAAFLLGWATQPMNAGQTTPYTTTEPPNDLASMTFYHGITLSDGTIKRRAWLGCKCEGFSLSCSADSPLMIGTFQIRASTPQGNQFDSSTDPTSGTFPAPADTAFPVDAIIFQHLAAGLTVGSSRTQFDAWGLDSKYSMDPKWFESRFVSVHRFWGRATTMTLTNYYKPSPTDRTSYEGVAAQSVIAAFTNGTHTLTFALNAQNIFSKVDDQLGIDKVFMQSDSIDNQWDASAGGDFNFTYA